MKRTTNGLHESARTRRAPCIVLQHAHACARCKKKGAQPGRRRKEGRKGGREEEEKEEEKLTVNRLVSASLGLAPLRPRVFVIAGYQS